MGNCTLTPIVHGKVSSPFWEHNPGSEERLPKANASLPTLTPQQVAAAMIRGIERNTRLIVLPRAFKFLFWLDFLFPERTQKVMRKGWKN